MKYEVKDCVASIPRGPPPGFVNIPIIGTPLLWSLFGCCLVCVFRVFWIGWADNCCRWVWSSIAFGRLGGKLGRKFVIPELVCCSASLGIARCSWVVLEEGISSRPPIFTELPLFITDIGAGRAGAGLATEFCAGFDREVRQVLDLLTLGSWGKEKRKTKKRWLARNSLNYIHLNIIKYYLTRCTGQSRSNTDIEYFAARLEYLTIPRVRLNKFDLSRSTSAPSFFLHFKFQAANKPYDNFTVYNTEITATEYGKNSARPTCCWI